MTSPSRGPKIDVYDMLSSYVSYEHKKASVTPVTIKARISTIRTFLEYNDVEISPRKFKLKVKMPKVVRQTKEALTKEDFVNILNACSAIKLKTYVLFLAATGCRASEAVSTRLCDYDFVKNKVFIRGEFTKTKTDRYVFLTNELVEQIKAWLTFKYRTRRITYNSPRRVEIRTPKRDENELLFSSTFLSENPTLEGLYFTLAYEFEKTLDRMGGMYAQFETAMKRRRKITLHSFRRHVKSTISDLGYGDYSEWFIGHSGSTYYRKSDKEKFELFQKISPYLTYLDFASLERKGADISTKIDELEQQNKELREQMKRAEEHEAIDIHVIQSYIQQLQQVLEKQGLDPDKEMKKFYKSREGLQIKEEAEEIRKSINERRHSKET
jgi:integrase